LPDPKVRYELLVPDLARKMEAFLGRLSPGAGDIVRPLHEPTEEFMFILSGALRIQLESREYTLNSGDSIYFDGPELRRLTCASDDEVIWISVITPPVF
jgi:quercetin dioxygenase-like cupin family protein